MREPRRLAAAALALALAGCVTVPFDERMLVSADAGAIAVVARPCGGVAEQPVAAARVSARISSVTRALIAMNSGEVLSV